MKKLSKEHTKIFCRLMDGIREGHEYVRILNVDLMPLDVVIINDAFEWPFNGSHAQEYELCQYYDINGDVVRDPLMAFVVLDGRTKEDPESSLVEVYPYKFEKGLPYAFTQSIQLINEDIYQIDRSLQRAQAIIAENWIDQLSQQGFLEQLEQGNIEQDDDDDDND